MQLIVLAAGKPYLGEQPTHLNSINGDFTVLDWITSSFNASLESLHCVVGFKVHEAFESNPSITYHFNSEWEETGACGSLLTVPLEDDTFIHYSDILIHKEVISNFLKKRSLDKILVGVDFIKDKREKIKINGETISFIGIIFIPKKYFPLIKEIFHTNSTLKTQHLSSLINAIIEKGVEVEYIDATNKWCDFDRKSNLHHFFLGTKAQTLERLYPLVQKSSILPLEIIYYEDWLSHKEKCIRKVLNDLQSENFIVRSSAVLEDSFEQSCAGKFDSVLNVSTHELEKAINKVFLSYTNLDKNNQVLIQPMLPGISEISGVVLTKSLQGAPYYIINYSTKKGDTTGVTSGEVRGTTDIILRSNFHEDLEITSWKKQLIQALKEIETIICYDNLDVEFSFCHNTLYILQIRPLVLSELEQDDFELIKKLVQNGLQSFKSISTIQNKTCFSVMSDWNPAEMIGFSPKPLAHTLYRHLITDETWARQRFEFGYQDVRWQPLMINFCGHPYIDVRKSIQSFLPRELSAEIVNVILDVCLSLIKEKPFLHDKIEFEVVPTCYSFSFDKWKNIFSHVLNHDQIDLWQQSLKRITKNAINNLNRHYFQLEILEDQARVIEGQGQNDIEKLWRYLELIKEYGTLPFAHLARSGFIAATFLKEATTLNLITSARVQQFLLSIETISSELQKDALRVKQGEILYEKFCEKYGHLRPGTYDIESLTYNDLRQVYIDPLIQQARKNESFSFIWEDKEKAKIESYLKENFDINFEQWNQFIQKAIYGREYAKFIFTRYISKVLKAIGKIADSLSVEKSQYSYLTIDELKNFFTGSYNFLHSKDQLRDILNHRQRLYTAATKVLLPSVLQREEDFYAFSYQESKPNFITQQTLTAPTYVLSEKLDSETFKEIIGKIIIIEKADPGYDWLFGYPIAGLITLYGGANSHMAIRCNEFNLPAAIGVGDSLYQHLVKSKIIYLDCLQHTVKVIQ